MNRKYRIAAVIGIGLAILPLLTARAQTEQQPTTAGAGEASAPSTIAPEDQATKEQLARLFEVMRLRQQIESMTKMLPVMIQQQVKAQTKEMAGKLPGGGSVSPEQQAVIDKLTTKYLEKALGIITVDELLDDMTKLYQRHLSGSDVEAFIAFYGSTPGQHLLDEQPVIMREYMPIVMKRSQERSKELTDEMMTEMEEVLKSLPPAGDKQ